MRIPKRYELFGYTIEVKLDPKLADNTGNVGTFRLRQQEIRLQPNTPSMKVPHADLENTFCHEMVHSILTTMGAQENNNEEFVSVFAGLLHQALTSMEYR